MFVNERVIVFQLQEKEDLAQISLTGARGLMLMELLKKAPRSLMEIKEEFVKIGLMEPEHSYDILRIDMNTLKAMGCEISRSSKATNNKHVLLKHPFELTVTDEEIEVIKKAYKKLKSNANLDELIKFDNLFSKIAESIQDKDMREKFYGISSLKSYDTFFLKTLQNDCKNKRTLRLIYQTPSSKQEIEKVIIAQELSYNNDKFYLCGIDTSTKKAIMLHLKRIKQILGRLAGDNSDIKPEKVNIKFILKNLGVAGLEDNEEILEKTENGYLVEGEYFNEFIAMQRMLSFGADCTVIEPYEFRQKIISKLKSMKEIYND